MAMIDHYGLLGISETERAHGVRNAFRDLSRAHHPERGGPEATRRYRETALAHAVLSDTTRRVIYERERAREAAAEVREEVARRASEQAHAHLIDDMETGKPSALEVLEHIRQNFDEADLPKSARVRVLSLRLVVPEGQDTLILTVPIYVPCTTCHGTGLVFDRACEPCDAQGMRENAESVRVGAQQHTVLLDDLGIHNLALEVTFAPS